MYNLVYIPNSLQIFWFIKHNKQNKINSCPSGQYGCIQQIGCTWLQSDRPFIRRCLNNRRSNGAVFVLTIMLDPKTCVLLCFSMQTYKKICISIGVLCFIMQVRNLTKSDKGSFTIDLNQTKYHSPQTSSYIQENIQ
jgi:hypothetical protein